jgi:hypothetical protein
LALWCVVGPELTLSDDRRGQRDDGDGNP